MKGKYINTTILLAALSGNKDRKPAQADAVRYTPDMHALLWSKSAATADDKPAYRSVTAMIH